MSLINVNDCEVCGIAISDILCFMMSNHLGLYRESLIRLSASAFSEEEINEAKKLLFSYKKPDRKGKYQHKNKKYRDLEDIMAVLDTTDFNLLPVCVAYDLHKFPSVTIEHVDIPALRREIKRLQGILADMKNKCVTKKRLYDSIRIADENDALQQGAETPTSAPIDTDEDSDSILSDFDRSSDEDFVLERSNRRPSKRSKKYPRQCATNKYYCTSES